MSRYSNADLDVTPPERRTWGVGNYASLWVSMSLCIPTYMLASSLIEGGMSWWQAILTVFLGNLVVLGPMLLNGDAGARYGIPFPVFARASFGLRGANVPALLRALVACGWFGIQTWIGGVALWHVLKALWPGLATLAPVFPAWVGLETGPALGFFLFWLVNLFVIHRGVEGIRRLLVFKAIFLPAAALLLLVWAIVAAGGLGPILARPSTLTTPGSFFAFFVPALTGMVGFWATLSLNIPDFTRYARSQRAHRVGQTIALPTSMAAFACVGVVVTSATAIIFGHTIWDPVALAARFESRPLVVLVMLAIAVSTLATNIAANIVSPANDFSNLAPSRITFRSGGVITAVIGVSDDYFPALTQPNVALVTEGITEIRAHSIVTKDGIERPVDALIFGTGFEITTMPSAKRIRDGSGRTLGETLGASPKAFLGTTFPGFPNFFMLQGPNTGLGHNSVIAIIEAQISLVLDAIRFLRQNEAVTLAPKPQALERFIAYVDRKSRGTVWTSGGCNSWYLDRTMRNSTLWPTSIPGFRRWARFKAKDYDVSAPGGNA